MISLHSHNTITIAPPRSRKRTYKEPESSPLNLANSTITLGAEEPIIDQIAPPPPLGSPYPLEPLLSNDTNIETQGDTT